MMVSTGRFVMEKSLMRIKKLLFGYKYCMMHGNVDTML